MLQGFDNDHDNDDDQKWFFMIQNENKLLNLYVIYLNNWNFEVDTRQLNGGRVETKNDWFFSYAYTMLE